MKYLCLGSSSIIEYNNRKEHDKNLKPTHKKNQKNPEKIIKGIKTGKQISKRKCSSAKCRVIAHQGLLHIM